MDILSIGHHHHHHEHRHTLSDVLIGIVVIGIAFTVFSIAMMRTSATEDPWHMLAVLVGIPSALTASFFCLVRGWENTR